MEEGCGVVRVYTFEVVSQLGTRSFGDYDDARNYMNSISGVQRSVWRLAHYDDGEHTRVSRMMIAAFKPQPIEVIVRSSVQPWVVYRKATFATDLQAREYAANYAYRCPGAIEVVFQ